MTTQQTKPKKDYGAPRRQLVPATESLFDFIKRNKVRGEVAADPTVISTEKKSAEQMVVTVRHYLEKPECYIPSNEKITVKTNIFGEKPGSLNISQLIGQLEKFIDNWSKDSNAVLKAARQESIPRNKYCLQAWNDFMGRIKSGETGMVGETTMQSIIIPNLGKFFPTVADQMAAGKLPVFGCHGPMHEFREVNNKYKNFHTAEPGPFSSHIPASEVVIPALSARDLERLAKALDKFASKSTSDDIFAEFSKSISDIIDESELKDRNFCEKGIMRSSENETAAIVPAIWNSGVDSGYTLLEEYMNYVYSVITAWSKIALLSLRRNLSVAVENFEEIKDSPEALGEAVADAYAEFTPATEGFIDTIKQAIKKVTGKNNDRFRPDGAIHGGFGFSDVNKKLEGILDDALKNTYDNPKWVEKNVSEVPSNEFHKNYGIFYKGGKPVEVSKIVYEFEGNFKALGKVAAVEAPHIGLRKEIYKELEKIANNGDPEERVAQTIALYDKNKKALETHLDSRIPSSVTSGDFIGCNGSLIDKEDTSLNTFWPSKDTKPFSYPTPTKQTYPEYVKALRGLLELSDQINKFLKSPEGRKFSLPYFEDIPQYVWDDMEVEHEDYYDKILSNVSSTQSRSELIDFYYELRNQVYDAATCMYNILFNQGELKVANEDIDVDIGVGDSIGTGGSIGGRILEAVANDFLRMMGISLAATRRNDKRIKTEANTIKAPTINITIKGVSAVEEQKLSTAEQRRKRLRTNIENAIAEVYGDERWNNSNIPYFSGDCKHKLMGFLQKDGWSIAINKVVPEYRKSLDAIAAFEKRIGARGGKARRELIEEINRAYAMFPEPRRRIDHVSSAYDRRWVALESSDYDHAISSLTYLSAIGTGKGGTLLTRDIGNKSYTFNCFDPAAIKDGRLPSYSYPARGTYKEYLRTIRALLDEIDIIDTRLEKEFGLGDNPMPTLPEKFKQDCIDNGKMYLYDKISKSVYDKEAISPFALYNQVARQMKYALMAVHRLLFANSPTVPAMEGLTDKITGFFKGDGDLNKIISAISHDDVLVDNIVDVINKKYDDQQWVSSLKGSNVEANTLRHLSYSGRVVVDGSTIIKHVEEITNFIEQGCKALSKDIPVRKKLLDKAIQRDEDEDLKDFLGGNNTEIFKILDRVGGYFKPRQVIGGGEWFTPNNLGQLKLSIHPSVQGVVVGPTASKAAEIKKDAIDVTKAVSKCISRLKRMSEDYAVGFYETVSGKYDQLYNEAIDELGSGSYYFQIAQVLFDGEKDGYHNIVSSPAAIAFIAEDHLRSLLKAYYKWVLVK